MDRELTDQEKDRHRKEQGGSPQRRSPDAYGSFYPKVIKWLTLLLFLVMPLLLDPAIEVVASALNYHVTDQQSLPSEHPNEALLQVYAARTWGPKGMFAVHSWIAMKQQGSEAMEVSQVIGWRQGMGGNVLFRETNVPVNSWWGNEATLLLELRGKEAVKIIDKVDAAISAYPWSNEYQLYPGPNSNTFVSWVGLQVPELGLDLPSTAIGKDWRPLEDALGISASGTGVQASLLGLLSTSMGFEEGLELNILGLNFELDIFDLAVEIPLFGRYECWYLLSYILLWVYMKKRLQKFNSKDFYQG